MAAKPNDTTVDEARLLPNGEENTKLVTPSSCTSDKTTVLDNFIMQVVVPMSASNSGSEPCDGGVLRSLKPNPDECNTPTLRCGQKQERESEDPSEPAEESREEFLLDYDVRCAELWINGEMAACEAYELSKSTSNTQRQHTVRQQANRPLTQSDLLHFIRTELQACYQPITKMLRLNMERSRAEFTELISRLNAMHRDTREMLNEVCSMRADERLVLDTISLMSERMNVIQRFMCDIHQVLTT